MPESLIKFLEYCNPVLALIIYALHMVKASHASKKYGKMKNIQSYNIGFLSEEVVYKQKERKKKRSKKKIKIQKMMDY